MVDESGEPQRAHLQAALKAPDYGQHAKARKELEGPALTPGLQYVWRWFVDLNATRGSNGFGPNPLSYLEVAAWAELNGVTLRTWEVVAIRRLDRVVLDASAERSKKAGK